MSSLRMYLGGMLALAPLSEASALIQSASLPRSAGSIAPDFRRDRSHVVIDTNGLPVRLALTAGEAHDNPLAGRLLDLVENDPIVILVAGSPKADHRPA